MSAIQVGPFPGTVVCGAYKIAGDVWSAMTPAERCLFRFAYAADYAKVQEVPRGSNKGPEVDRVLMIAGVDPGNPWCASQGTAYLVDSGVARNRLPEDAASVHAWGEWAGERGWLVKVPARAMFGLIYHTATTGHLVAIAGVEGTNVRTIEGNSNDEGSREGYETCRRVRAISEFHGFVDVRKLTA